MEIKEVPLLTVWHIRKEVMYPNLTIEQVQLPDDETGEHLGLYHHNNLCSVISLFKRDTDLQFRKFATVTHLQGKGYGSTLLAHIFERAKEQHVHSIWCNARTIAVPFYQKFGMETLGETWEQLGHLFVKMQHRFVSEESSAE